MKKANEKSNPSEQEPAEELGRVSSVKAQNLGTMPQPQDSELAGHLGSLMSALDSEQSQWEKDNPPENYNPEAFRAAIKSWRKQSATPELELEPKSAPEPSADL